MLVHRPRLKTQGAVVTTVALALSGCDDPTARTDLRPEGPPDVLSVLVLSDALNGLVETATFCKTGDEKRPALVGLPDATTQQVCPLNLSEAATEATNAAPEAWYVRIMFDELLDPDIEDLRTVTQNGADVTFGTLERTQPVTLQCEDFAGALVNVAYDGYYSPSGNAVTWPLGPSLVIKPLNPETISVNSACQITLKENIVDKDGTPVPGEQRGPFRFKLAPIAVVATAPADRDTVDPEASGVELIFNTSIDPASLTADDVTFTPAVTNVGAARFAANDFLIFGDILDDTDYTFQVKEGAKITDHCNKESTFPAPSVAENTEVKFSTTPMDFVTVAPFQGEGLAPGRKIRLDFNQNVDPASITADEFTITPPLQDIELMNDVNGDTSIILVYGQYALNTQYTFELKTGATVTDLFGMRTFTVTAENPIKAQFRTAPSLALTASTPASGTVAVGATTIRLTFNQEMDPDTFIAGDDFTFVNDATGAVVPTVAIVDPVNPLALRIRSTNAGGALPAGDYTFTFKNGAAVSDKLATPNVFMQTSDRVIKIKIQDPPVSPPCLGAPAP